MFRGAIELCSDFVGHFLLTKRRLIRLPPQTPLRRMKSLMMSFASLA
jgi:hypothetical protein